MGASAVDVTLSSGRELTRHEPGMLEYCLGFSNVTDYIVYEIGAYERLDIRPGEKVIFKIQPSVGEVVRFTGIPYAMERKGKANQWRLVFVSEYWKGLMSMAPTYGKGSMTSIAATVYSAAGVPKVVKDETNTSVDQIAFPANTRRTKALTYLLNRAPTSKGGFIMGTVVGDVANLIDVKNGREDITGVHYEVVRIRDARKRVDAMGGLFAELASDSEDVPNSKSTNPGTNEISVKQTYNISDPKLAEALLKVRQARAYYSGYLATIGVLGWIPMLGRNLKIAEGDVYRDLSWMNQLDDGRYFVHSQVLHLDFKKSLTSMQCGLMLVDDKV